MVKPPTPLIIGGARRAMQRRQEPISISSNIPVESDCAIETESCEPSATINHFRTTRINLTPQSIMGGPGEKFMGIGTKRPKNGIEIDIVDQGRSERSPKKSLLVGTNRNAINPSFRTSSQG